MPDYCHNAMLGDSWTLIPIHGPVKSLALDNAGRACAVNIQGERTASTQLSVDWLCRANFVSPECDSSGGHI